MKRPRPALVNKYGPTDLRQKLASETFERKTLSFYRYVRIEDPRSFRDALFLDWDALGCLGRIYVAREGINAQMNVPIPQWDAFLESLERQIELREMPLKIAVEESVPSFLKLTIKVRHKIVADGLADDAFDTSNVGRHLTAREWNEMLRQGATVVDIRNFYESEVGHFEGALLPQAETFRDELPEVLNLLKGREDEPVMLYCTGGIRCEKTSAYLKHHGFRNVNQLYGGIIDYARQVRAEGLDNLFRGKNFVFDQRLGERISEEVIAHCHQCGSECDTHVNCANAECNVLFIQCPACAAVHQGRCSECDGVEGSAPTASNLDSAGEHKRRVLRVGTSSFSGSPVQR
ncbi:rhodanese-related sulfurtransferase [bacterium]|nr:rhodanese-related sulfurtransferase [bacterium]